MPAHTIDLAPLPAPAADTSAEAPRRTSALAIALGSFVLGAGAAVGLVVALDPFKQLMAPPQVVQNPPVPAVPPVAVFAPAAAPAAPAQVAATAPVEAPQVPSAAAIEPPTAVAAVTAPPPAEVAAAVPPPEAIAPAAPAPDTPAPASPTPEPPNQVAEPIAPAPIMRAPVMPEPAPPQPRVASRQIETPVVSPVVQSPPAAPDHYKLDAPARLELRAGARQPFALRIEPMPKEAAALLAVFRDVPEWLTFSKGSAIGNEIWLLPAHLASDLMVELADGADGTAQVKVQLASADGRMLSEAVMSIRAVRGSVVPALPSPMVADGALVGDQGVLRLMARAELLLDTGEIESARTLLRRAAESGSVGAALKLAETYDPSEVQRLGMAEASADPGEAVRWYEHAQSLGSVVATGRLVALGRR